MKNIKNMVAAGSLMAILMVGTASANTELLMSDESQPKPAECTVEYTTVIKDFVKDIIIEIFGNPRIRASGSEQEVESETSTCTQEMNGYKPK